MKKYIIAVLVLLGMGSCYYASQNKGDKQEVTKESQDSFSIDKQNMKSEIEKLSYLSVEEKSNYLSKLGEIKDLDALRALELEATKTNLTSRIGSLNYLSTEAKSNYLSKLDGLTDLEAFKEMEVEVVREDLKSKIESLEYLSAEQKAEYLSKLENIGDFKNKEKYLEEFKSLDLDLTRENALNKIDSFSNLSAKEKENFKTKLTSAKFENLYAIVEEAKKMNGNENSGNNNNESQNKNEVVAVDGNKLVVNFALDSYYLSPQDKEQLKAFVTDKKINGLSIVGHTDRQGTEEYNQGLSEKRAQVVYDYFKNELNLNVEMKESGEGELNPISDLPRRNRRTEITIF